VEYNVLQESELTLRQVREIEHVAGIIGIETKDAALVLRYFGWNKDLLMEKYMVSFLFSYSLYTQHVVLNIILMNSVFIFDHSIGLARESLSRRGHSY
jgi:hypothetical protein